MLDYDPESRLQNTSLLQHNSQQPSSYNQHGSIPVPAGQQQFQHQHQHRLRESQPWIPSTLPLTQQSTFHTSDLSNNINFNFGSDLPLFEHQLQQQYQPQPHQQYQLQQQYQSIQSQPLMQSIQSNNSWMSHGQLTPTSISRPNYYRESSISSLGSPAAPASPYAPSTSNPQIAGDSYHEFQDFSQPAPKTLTPAHTPLQENFLTPHYQNYSHQTHLGLTMSNGLPKVTGDSNELPEFHSQGSSRPSLTTVASNDSPSTPQSHEDERQQFAHRTPTHQMPKLGRTMTDAYNDELFNPSYPIISASSLMPTSTRTSAAPTNDIFTQRLQAANHEHLNAIKQEVGALSPRERSPFQAGSPLAPSTATFNTHNMPFGTATRMREQQKAKDDALAMQGQYERTIPEQSSPKTISPKDVDLVYHEDEEDADSPLFESPKRRQLLPFHQQPLIAPDPSESEEISLSQQSYASMATTRRESSSAYSTTSQTTPKQSQFNFAASAISDNVRQLPQHYPFVPATKRESSNMSSMSNMSNGFAPMESSSSDYSPDPEIQRPSNTSADSGTYTCTYNGCTLRFETPYKLQKHKREGHRNSMNHMGGENRGGMTSTAHKLNSQSGPHKCERINPSTGKPCNTIFSRPYDLTRHEDTIHNAAKQKLRCQYCTEEKTFSRNDALTRHLRVVHPEVPNPTGKGKRRGMGLNNMG